MSECVSWLGAFSRQPTRRINSAQLIYTPGTFGDIWCLFVSFGPAPHIYQRGERVGGSVCTIHGHYPESTWSSVRLSGRAAWYRGTCPTPHWAGVRISRGQVNMASRALQLGIVSCPIQPNAEFDLFSREVTVATRTIPSSPLEPTLQPLRHPHPHSCVTFPGNRVGITTFEFF